MSVAIARADRLCIRCVNLGEVTDFDICGPLEVAVDGNDLCRKCLMSKGSYVRDVDYVKEAALVKRVIRRSPYHRAIRWAAWWNSWGLAACILIMCLVLIFIFAMGAAVVGGMVRVEELTQ